MRSQSSFRGSPLIYNFRHYFGLGRELGRSFRATTPYPASGAARTGAKRVS